MTLHSPAMSRGIASQSLHRPLSFQFVALSRPQYLNARVDSSFHHRFMSQSHVRVIGSCSSFSSASSLGALSPPSSFSLCERGKTRERTTARAGAGGREKAGKVSAFQTERQNAADEEGTDVERHATAGKADLHFVDKVGRGTAVAALSMSLWLTPAAMNLPLSCSSGGIGSAWAATNSSQVGACVLSRCPEQLGKCLADGPCVKNLVCIQSCVGRDDETACQIRCGDRYQDAAVDVFNSCAVSAQKCVPQRVDEDLYPIPPDDVLDKKFNLSAFQGRWYITAGLNPLFDRFPCQEHYFAQPEESSKDTVYAQINWRIPLPGDDFIQRSTMQRFVQDQSNPAILFNHDNEYLHYEDDWYILASKPNNYVFVYYRGQNDAWKGYGGATVYTRAASLPPEIVPELREAAERAGLDWDQFKITDNSCPPKPPRRGPFEQLEEDVMQVERFAVTEVSELERDVIEAENAASREIGEIEKALEPALKSFGKGFTVLTQEVEDVAEEVEEEAEKEAAAASKLIRRFQMEASMGVFGKIVQALPLKVREFIMPMP